MANTHDFIVAPGGRLTGNIQIPGDKSICHRALILGAMATGQTQIDNFLESADCLATLGVLQALGVEIKRTGSGKITVHGNGMDALQAPAGCLDCGNSGTSMRLLAGLMAGQPFESVLCGDASLHRRPMQRIIEPLTRMGAIIRGHSSLAPLTINGRRPLMPIRYELPVASAQVKTCLLLAGLQAKGKTWLKEPFKTRDHTERMLPLFGCGILHDGDWFGIEGGQSLDAADIAVPGDLSSAAFFIAAAAAQPGSHVVLESIGINPSREGLLRVLRAMGAHIRLLKERMLGNEPVADIEVHGTSLQAMDIGPDIVPLAIDELPALLIAAASAQGVSSVRGAKELRYKESDRLQAMATGLQSLGVVVELWDDGIQVTGRKCLSGGIVDSFGDHRIAMAFAMAAPQAQSPIHIRNCRNVGTSFPNFAQVARAAGLRMEVRETPCL